MDLSSNIFLKLNLIGNSETFNKALAEVRKVSAYNVGVFLYGETGTGKELIARAIHYFSDRCDNPFIPVNCGALSDDLFMDELFGHKKGAYTGADNSRAGLIESARGGTLMLDEIDSLSEKSQVSLLRFLQSREYKSIGASTLKSADVRIISASNKRLEDLVAAKKFRNDLYYRLDILRVEIPPLRERKGDIPLLADHFMKKISRDFNIEYKPLSDRKTDILNAYSWPGNVRELENFIFKLCLQSEERHLRLLNGVSNGPGKTKSTSFGDFNHEKQKVINSFEKQYLKEILKLTGGNVSRAAKHAQKERSCFSRLMKKHGINRDNYLHAK